MKKYLITTLLLISAFIFASCSGAYTDISATWTKPGYKTLKFNRILVVAISNEIVKRNSVESAFVNELAQKKITATTSYGVVDLSILENEEDGKLDSAEIAETKKKLDDAGYDGAIIISLLDVKEKTEYVPGQTYYHPRYYSFHQPYAYRGFYNYYYTTYNMVTTPGYYVNRKSIFIETRLFDLKGDEMVWASNSETKDPSNLKAFSSSLAREVVNAMLADKAVR